MEENRQKNSKKRLNSLILLVAFTAIMLIVSTYAWFSAQRNVSISNLEGIVNVVEGLEISLDASHWSQAIDLKVAKNNPTTSGYFGTGYDLETPYEDGANILPSELIPVSTTGISGEGIGKTELQMYRGINVGGCGLYSIQLTDASKTSPTDNQFPGYYAIDLFLKNTSAESVTKDQLQLNINSQLQLLDSGLNNTGLQNTVRVAFALYNTTKTGTDDVDVVKGTQDSILAATTGTATIKDVAIWEPNADSHVTQIVENQALATKITWSTGDVTDYFGGTARPFANGDILPTYALTSTSTSATDQVEVSPGNKQNGIGDIYDWSDTSTSGLTKQIVQATANGALTTETNLVSVTGTKAAPVNFEIPANEVCRIRMYVWLEGQDVDCLNLASHGGGIKLDLGIVKPASSNS